MKLKISGKCLASLVCVNIFWLNQCKCQWDKAKNILPTQYIYSYTYNIVSNKPHSDGSTTFFNRESQDHAMLIIRTPSTQLAALKRKGN